MADLLLEKETIYAEDIEPILGPSAQSAKQAADAEGAEPCESATATDAAAPKPENEEQTRKI